MTEKATGLYDLDDADHATVLAALRFYQQNGQGNPENRSMRIHELATNGGEVMASLDDAGIEALCESLNHAGLTFGDVVQLIGSGPEDVYAAAARDHWKVEEGSLEVDLPAVVNHNEDGAYVMAWLFVSNEDAGL